jgi:hypothetical protein
MKSFFCFLLLIINFSSASATPCFPTKHAEVPNITNKSYHQARKELLANQWQPLRTIPIHEAKEMLKFSGNGWGFWEKGYQEVEACSGTGFAPCVFNFTDIYGNLLKVHTLGEELTEDEIYAEVSEYGFACKAK